MELTNCMHNTYMVFGQMMIMAFLLPALTVLWSEFSRMSKLEMLDYQVQQLVEEQYDFKHGDWVAPVPCKNRWPAPGLELGMRLYQIKGKEENENLDRWEHLMGCWLI